MASLKKFASENLGPTCGPTNLDLCDEVDKKFIAKFQKWDIDELDISIEEKVEKINKMEATKQKVIDKLNNEIKDAQEKVQKEESKKEDAVAKEKKAAGYNYMKAVKASKTPKEEDKLEDKEDL